MLIIWQISGISLNYWIHRKGTSSISQIKVIQEDDVVQINQTIYNRVLESWQLTYTAPETQRTPKKPLLMSFYLKTTIEGEREQHPLPPLTNVPKPIFSSRSQGRKREESITVFKSTYIKGSKTKVCIILSNLV